jgi:hypothetical protein
MCRGIYFVRIYYLGKEFNIQQFKFIVEKHLDGYVLIHYELKELKIIGECF